MRIITDSDGRVLDVSFGALISCGGQDGADYTGTVPTGYTSLEDWFIKEADKLYRWTVVDGELTLDSSAVAPTDKLPAADYVVEQGTSGIWTYRKWNSGVAECWGVQKGSGTSTSGNNTTVTLPFVFADTSYSVLLTPANNGNIVTSYGDYANGGNVSHTTSSFVFRYKVSSAYTPNFNIRVEGTWK